MAHRGVGGKPLTFHAWKAPARSPTPAIAGNRKVLAGKIQERYGYAGEKADEGIDDWLTRH